MTAHADESRPPLVVMRFTRQLSALIDAGVSLMRCLSLLQQDMPPPFADTVRGIQDEVGEGHTLSRAFGRRPEYFSPIYAKMIRAGEVGGILEETLSYLADALEEEWRFSCRVEPREGWSGLLFASDQPPPADWADLSHSQQILTLFLFCRLLSDLLSSGIPTRLVIETVAELLPVAQREAVRAVAQADSWLRAAPLAQIGFLPAWVAELMLHGEQIGHLDAVMDKAAKVYRHQLFCELM